MRRLIEEAFPLKKASEDSKHEKSAGRKGHISTLHIWPARRPLAASRAAVIATLLPDPADAPPELRREYEALAGSSNPAKQREDLCCRIEKVTRWGKVDEGELERLRKLVKKAHGGMTPKVLDIFSGGGAIPLEAMRLGAHAIAVEYNPVAWFILKCTLEFPSRLAGKTWPLPETDTKNPGKQLVASGLAVRQGDLAAQVRYWGGWVKERVEKDLSGYFPKVQSKNPIVYFWARTVPCQDPQCGATVPLLKTQWLCTKKGKERALQVTASKKTRRVEFRVFTPGSKGEVGEGTVSNAKAFCPFHDPPLPLAAQYIKDCGKAGKMGTRLTAVCVEGRTGKEYRDPTEEEVAAAKRADADAPRIMAELPGGPLYEPLVEVRPAPNTRGVSSLARFGIVNYGQVFAPRQQVDINGEYEEALKPHVDPQHFVKTVLGGPSATFRIPYYALGRHGLSRLLLPSEKTQRPALAFALENLAYVKWFAKEQAAGLAASNAPDLFDDGRPGDAANAWKAIDVLRRGAAQAAAQWPNMGALGCLVAESHALKQGRTANTYERDAFHYSNVAPLVTRIRRCIEDPLFASVVDVSGGKPVAGSALDWNAEGAALCDRVFGTQGAAWKIHLVELRNVAHDLMPLVLGSLLELLAFELFKRGQDQTYPTLLVLEEAHHYLRQFVDGGEESGRNSLAYERLAKEGRKFGLSLWLSTQRPAEVSSTVLAQCGTWVVFRLASEQDLKAVASAGEWVDRQELSRIAGLPRQQAVVFGAGVTIPARVIAPTADPRPKSRDPDFSRWAAATNTSPSPSATAGQSGCGA